MPIIFASAFINAPTVISGWFPQSGFTKWWGTYFNHMTIWYNLAYFILVIFFAYFYNTIAYDPDEIAKSIQNKVASYLEYVQVSQQLTISQASFTV